MPTADEIMRERSDADYLRHAIKWAGARAPYRAPRWSFVANLFGCGSGVSSALCKRFGLDPDEMMGRDWSEGGGEVECPTCGTLHEVDE